MSWEAWGDPPEGPELPEGWWDDEQVAAMRDAVMALSNETLYEGGKMENGISVRFLARISVLKLRAGLVSADNPYVAEGLAILGETP
jgi:hypothetical protein